MSFTRPIFALVRFFLTQSTIVILSDNLQSKIVKHEREIILDNIVKLVVLTTYVVTENQVKRDLTKNLE